MEDATDEATDQQQGDPAHDPGIASLAESARALIDRIRRTHAPAEELAAARAAIDAVTEQLDAWIHEGPYAQAALDGSHGLLGQSRDPMQIFPYSPLIGRLNPVAPPAEFRHVDGKVVGEVTLGAAYCGPPHHVHGGVVAALMDELLGTVNVVNGLGAMTGRLTIHYRAATPLGRPLRLEASHTGSDGRKVFAEGRILDGDRLLVEAEGLFIRPRDASLFQREAPASG